MADEVEETTEGGKGLRAQLEAVLQKNKELETRLAEASGKARAAEVKSVLEAKGVNPKVAKFIGNDVDDIEAWLTENADVFGFTVGQGTQEPNVAPDEVQATQRIQNTAQSTVPAGKAEDIQARMSAATSDKELEDIWSEARSFFL